jgi:hypothetical protein
VLTYLSVETYASGYYGRPTGEFRFRIDVPQDYLGAGIPPVDIFSPARLFDVGVGLRVNM